MKNDILYTVSEVATILLVSTQTVRNYIEKRLLKAKRKGPNKCYVIKEKHLDKFMAKGYATNLNREEKKKAPEKKASKRKPKVIRTIKNVFYTPLSKKH